MIPDIRNIAFDFGNVLVNVHRERIFFWLTSAYGVEEPESIFKEVFSHDDFRGMESGILDETTFSRRLLDRLHLLLPGRTTGARGVRGDEVRGDEVRGDDVRGDEIEDFLRMYTSLFTVKEGMDELLVSLAEDHPVHILSNTSKVHWEWSLENLPFLSHITSAVLSYEERVMKPDRTIYERLLERTGGTPGALLFFDDLPENVKGARDLGIDAHLFTTRSACIEVLQLRGIV